jgi:hypothetical protein
MTQHNCYNIVHEIKSPVRECQNLDGSTGIVNDLQFSCTPGAPSGFLLFSTEPSGTAPLKHKLAVHHTNLSYVVTTISFK